MKLAAFFTAAFASTAFAISVSINATTSGINQLDGSFQIISADLYTLDAYLGLEVTALELVQAQTIPPTDVKCRMYRYAAGTQAGSLPFSGSTKALISANMVTVGSIACYGISPFKSLCLQLGFCSHYVAISA